MHDECCYVGQRSDERYLFIGGPLNFSWNTEDEYGRITASWRRYYTRAIPLPVSFDMGEKLEDCVRVARTVYVYGGVTMSYPLMQLVLAALNRGPAPPADGSSEGGHRASG